jgi:hypothetical protein
MGRTPCKRLFRRSRRKWERGWEANGTSPGSCPKAGFCISGIGPSDSATILSDMYRYRAVQIPWNGDPKCLFMVALNMRFVFSLCAHLVKKVCTFLYDKTLSCSCYSMCTQVWKTVPFLLHIHATIKLNLN